MPIRIIYLVAFLEGFSTLAVEIIAMRLAVPVVGSSIVLTSVFLGVILLALSVGYWSGGILSSKLDRGGQIRALGFALLFAGLWYVLLSFSMERGFLEYMMETSGSYIFTLFVVSLVLFFPPVFVASHTIPLLTELLDEPSKGKAAGAMLFASTVGSFFGSVVTSIVLFELWGVSHTGVVVGVGLVFLAALVFFIHNRAWALIACSAGCLLGLVYGMQQEDIHEVFSFDSAYQHIRVYDAMYRGEDIRIFSTNGSLSSAKYLDPSITGTPFMYIDEVLSLTQTLQPKDILVIGAAGFTYPQTIAKSSYVQHVDTVDIDPQVKDVAEKYFLEQELDSKITFYPTSARGAIRDLHNKQKLYDLIFLDAYNDKSVPEELMTVEFFQSIKRILSPEGVVVANMIMDKALDSRFSNSVFVTMNQVFDEMYYKNVTNNPNYEFDNFIVSSVSLPGYALVDAIDGVMYTDDRNGAGMDSVKMLYVK